MYYLYFLECLMLIASLTTDAFATGVSYGVGKIKLPKSSAIIVSLICSTMLLVSILCGKWFSVFIDDRYGKYLCFIILFTLGVIRLFDLIIKSYIKSRAKINLHFAIFKINFILTVYADSKLADTDNSKTLSVKEAVALAIALSLDGLAVGFGVALGSVGAIMPFCMSVIMTFVALKLGELLGAKICFKSNLDLSYFSAILLICLAFFRI